MTKSIRPLIICGGAGTRLWPLSRNSLPKQFVPLLGEHSSFQETVLRVRGPDFVDRPLVLTNRAHRFLVERQLAEIGVEADIVLEPCRRESGPAILAGCAVCAADGADEPVLVVAADQVMRDGAAFRAAVAAAVPAAQTGHLVTFGITPTHPATEYGYIEPGPRTVGSAFLVYRFAEKPAVADATGYILSGYLWNSGNFLFLPRILTEEYRRLAPRTVEMVCQSVAEATDEGGALALEAKSFGQAESKSIDYAVMEHTSLAAVVQLSCGWSDVGNWNALWSLSKRDACENVQHGDVELLDAHRCFVSSEGALTSLVGVSDLVVVVNRDAILVADRNRTADVKQVVEALRYKGRAEAETHTRVYRPWGWYQVIDGGDAFQVKRIVVLPQGRLSLQKHQHRSEHWIVVSGTARITVDSTVRAVSANDHVHIPAASIHRLENPGDEPVELIEVQNGTYFGEDDIVRLEDAYHRA
ncbi:MAG: mannose-1-phosphate guanylyltransferase/mannose-6-phosphate isomerase [Alphaproteobacteria bacterium]|nr:mannose-1-phosphate guanylyltransferase/mannose-6-phosphate isomerase [Alphaproteobacteria bacterium]